MTDIGTIVVFVIVVVAALLIIIALAQAINQLLEDLAEK
jgi:hypothetical protein